MRNPPATQPKKFPVRIHLFVIRLADLLVVIAIIALPAALLYHWLAARGTTWIGKD